MPINIDSTYPILYSGKVSFFEVTGEKLLEITYEQGIALTIEEFKTSDGTGKIALNCLLIDLGLTALSTYQDCEVFSTACGLTLSTGLPALYVPGCAPFLGCVGISVSVGILQIIGSYNIKMSYFLDFPNGGNGNTDRVIYFNATGGTPPYKYSIDNSPFQTSNRFELSANHDYDLRIKDDNFNNCIVKFKIEL